MTPRAPSLFFRLTGAISVVLLLGAGILTAAAHDYARRAANDAYDRLLLGAASQIRETVRVEDGMLTTDIPVSAFDTLSISRRERIYYRVTGPNGAFLTGYEDLPGPEATRTDGGPQVWDSVFKGEPVRMAALRHFVSDPASPGWATVLVAQTRESRVALARELTLRAILPVGIMSLIALVGAALAVRYALRPLARIEAALTARASHDLTPLAVEAPREIEALVTAINRFMNRLGLQVDELQRMIADAAHQIRTPITALAAQVELLRNETAPQRRRHHLERVSARTAQIGRLINQLLSHAMINNRAERMAMAVHDARDIIQQAVSDAVPAAMGRDIAVNQSESGGPFLIKADAVSLREALRNIIENAVQHGAAGRIGIAIHGDGQMVIVEIGDDGPGIAPQHWPHVTKRFYRADGQSEGFGLGLAIVADVASSHGAELAFDHAANGDFLVRLTLPASGEAGT